MSEIKPTSGDNKHNRVDNKLAPTPVGQHHKVVNLGAKGRLGLTVRVDQSVSQPEEQSKIHKLQQREVTQKTDSKIETKQRFHDIGGAARYNGKVI